MIGFRSVLAGAVALLVLTAPASAQGRDCTIVDIAETGYARQLAGPGGTVMRFVKGPVEIHCQGGIVVRADSAHSTGTGVLHLIEDVFYSDSAKSLTSATATYDRNLGRLTARGDVVLRDRFGPSVIRGTELTYERATGDRPERTIVRGRPRAYLYEEGTPPLPEGMEPSPGLRIVGGDTIPAALQVDADRLEMQGEARMLAHGRVQIIREDVRAFAEAADYDQAAGHLELTSSARIEGEGFELFGDRITADLMDEELERVVSTGNALLVGEDVRVEAPLIDIGLAGGEVERMIAVSRQEGVLASAVARDFTLVGDSLQLDAPAQRLERIVAVGHAYGEQSVDSLDADLPELIRADWLSGDTIIGTFLTIEAGEAEGDTAQTTLETLTASGSARSLYRMEATNDEAEQRAVNYMIASRIAIRFTEGEVANVHAEGPVEGLHLEPLPVAREEDPAEGTGGEAPAPDQGGEASR